MNKLIFKNRWYQQVDDAAQGVEDEEDVSIDELLDSLGKDEEEEKPKDEPRPLTADDLASVVETALDARFKPIEERLNRPEPKEEKKEEPAPTIHPVQDVRRALTLEQDLIRQAKELYPDFPPEAESRLLSEIRQYYPTTESLERGKSEGWIVRLTHSIVGEMIQAQKYIPASLRTARLEPVHSERTVPEVRISPRDQLRIDTVNKVIADTLGEEHRLTKDDYKAAVRRKTQDDEMGVR